MTNPSLEIDSKDAEVSSESGKCIVNVSSIGKLMLQRIEDWKPPRIIVRTGSHHATS